MTEGMEQRHLTNGASLQKKALEFTASSIPKAASDCRSPKAPAVQSPTKDLN
jgi:hypothetical protein